VDYTCTPCKGVSAPWEHPTNFTGIATIVCSYKYDLCTRLRVEHRTCRKAQSRVCKPVVGLCKLKCS
jgi:hypothetical protein